MVLITRHRTQTVYIGSLPIGGQAPVAIQSMNNTDTRDVEASLEQIHQLKAAGCDLTRLAIPDQAAARAFARIHARSPLPLVADIHFDHRLALAAIAAGADKIRINPGNIGGADRLKEVADAARARGIPIRVGVNAGSLSPAMRRAHGGVNAQAMVASVLEAKSQLEACDFNNLVLSIKASDPVLTVEAYRLLAQQTNNPLHIGVTEAGTLRGGLVRSAVGIGSLLINGLGDTVRVSLTADPVEEVKAAWQILKTLGLRERGPTLICCPTCGRTEVNLQAIATAVEDRLEAIDEPLTVAVMGCVVNGPGEARQADVGLAGGQGSFVIFKEGRVVRKVTEEQAVDALMEEVAALARLRSKKREASHGPGNG